MKVKCSDCKWKGNSNELSRDWIYDGKTSTTASVVKVCPKCKSQNLSLAKQE